MDHGLDDTDKLLLNRIQSDFPLTPRPYLTLAAEFGLAEAEVIKRLRRLKDHGIIRRIGGNFAPEKVGFVSTLCAARVPEDQINAFARVVNRFPGVTHNYQRGGGAYNVWFTFIAPTMEMIQAELAVIVKETGITDILNLPATKVFKIRAHFNLLEDK